MEKIVLDAEEYDWLVARLEEEPRELPRLRALIERASVFEREES